MNMRTASDDEPPLDPATEKVRRKMAKFIAVFMSINLVALMAVLGAIVYKLGGYGAAETAAPDTATNSAATPVWRDFERAIDLPEGAAIVSASENNGRVVLNLKLADGSAALWFYDVGRDAVTGKLAIR